MQIIVIRKEFHIRISRGRSVFQHGTGIKMSCKYAEMKVITLKKVDPNIVRLFFALCSEGYSEEKLKLQQMENYYCI